MGKIVFFVLFFFIGCDIKNQHFEINATDDVLVFKKHEDAAFLRGNERLDKSIATIKKGEKLRIIDSYQQKDYLAYKIKTANGVEGFVIHGDNIVVTEIGREESQRK